MITAPSSRRMLIVLKPLEMDTAVGLLTLEKVPLPPTTVNVPMTTGDRSEVERYSSVTITVVPSGTSAPLILAVQATEGAM